MNILIADDDCITVKLLSAHLSRWGHTVYQATNGDDAWKVIERTPIDIVIIDWIMPGLDGPQLSRRIRRRQGAYIYLILISAQVTKEAVVRGLESGVDDYMTKPMDMNFLRAKIDVGSRIVNLERALKQKIEIITDNHYQTIRMFSQLVEVFDEALGGHCRRTARLSVDLAHRHSAISTEEIPTIETAALLHDIGMVGIPKSILNKHRTELVHDERRLYLSHPAMGARIVGQIEILKPAALLINAHHEQINGKGFPGELSGEEIPLGAQLISAASIYDNLRYRGNLPLNRIPERLHQMSGYQLSPEVVSMLIESNLKQRHEEKRKKNQEHGLEELKAGMVLAANIYLRTGAFVMAADTELDGYSIDKLNHYYSIGAITDKVLIRIPT